MVVVSGPNLDGMGADILNSGCPGPARAGGELGLSRAIQEEHELQWIVLWIGCRRSEGHCCASYLGAG